MTRSTQAAWLEKVYTARDMQELADGYDAWAEDYDNDLMSFGYKIPAVTSGFIGRYVPSGSRPLLDAGAGTGIMGETLSLLGFDSIVAIDLSNGMLEQARKKNVYSELHQMTLGEPLDFPDNTFAATIATGVFTTGHAPASAFEELIRVTRSGGHIIFSVRADAYLEMGYKDRQAELEQAGRWRLVEITAPFQSLPLGEPDVRNQTLVCQVI
jgi:predicted TPR repeat methyltransferase